MATRAEIRKKLGIVTLEDPAVANKELSEKDALEYENFMKSLLDFNKEIDENIKSFCSRCKYDIVNIGLHFFHKDVRLYAASCSEV